jgi:putative peptide zinc metalloprotease protein
MVTQFQASRPTSSGTHPSAATSASQHGALQAPDRAQTRQPEAVAADAPELPRLAPGVRLAGRMKETAFVDPAWLLEREGVGYVQITELLYRIAEHCTGECTLEEIAQKASVATGRTISAGNVRHLVTKQLIPNGLVLTADGTVVGGDRLHTRSPLAVNMKMAMISPRIIDPISRVLTILYWPPVLIGVLALAAVAQAWMYLVHGVGGGVHHALYTPGLILVIVGALVLSAGFHEFGHAAALRYGGGQVKAMGAGIYLVYPAFYTDVSDNYRLPRWARVRTDLAGFYFNLIFALGVIALYLATGHEFLLLIVVLINVEIVHQLLPFVRLDGYWTLADLTGIPDFFSQMGAFVRSLLPIPGWKGRKLPELKWWAKAIFVVYIIVTIPLLLFLLFLMVKSTPRILATAWDSFGLQARALSTAWGTSDLVGMAASLVQMLFLALPTLGLLLTLNIVVRRVGAAIWNWSRPTPTRRALGALGTLAVVGLVGFLWIPQLPFAGNLSGLIYQQIRLDPIRGSDEGIVFYPVDPFPAGLPPMSPLAPADDREETPPASAPSAEPTSASSSGPESPGAAPGATPIHAPGDAWGTQP